jgi:hypothetical protein
MGTAFLASDALMKQMPLSLVVTSYARASIQSQNKRILTPNF